MLAHLLAIAIALGSFLLYFSAFFFPEVHRKSDFYWSGLGLFYGLVLWVCAGRITGGVLLGQTASVALLLWFGTQTLILRRALTSPTEKTNVSQNIATRLQRLSPINFLQKIKGSKTAPTQPQPMATETSESEAASPAPTETSQEQTTEENSEIKENDS